MRIAGIRSEHVRLSLSAVQETLRSVEVLLQPSLHAEQMPWIRAARRRLRPQLKNELSHFRFLFVPAPELFPTISEKLCGPDALAGIGVLRRSRPSYIEAIVRRLSGARLLERGQFRGMVRPGWYRQAAYEAALKNASSRAMLEEFVASPASSLERFASMLEAMHANIIKPVWGELASRLREDVAMRRNVLDSYGLLPFLRTLSPQISIHRSQDGTAELEVGPGHARIELGRRGRLELSPSFFCWPHTQAYVVNRPSGVRASIVYPIPPLPSRIRSLPDRRQIASMASALGNDLRLRILELLRGRDLSTRELAGFLSAAAPLISHHLHVLSQAGIVERYRSGYFVMYRLNGKTLAKIARSVESLTPCG